MEVYVVKEIHGTQQCAYHISHFRIRFWMHYIQCLKQYNTSCEQNIVLVHNILKLVNKTNNIIVDYPHIDIIKYSLNNYHI